MNDKTKLGLIDQMIANYYEFCSFDDNGMNAGSLQMLIGCIEAVIMQDNEEEGEEEREVPHFCRHDRDILACPGDCFFCPLDADDDEDYDDGDEDDECCECCDACNDRSSYDLRPDTVEAIHGFTEALSKYAALLSAIADED